MLDIKIKPKSCRICKELFIPRSGLQKVCGIGCAYKKWDYMPNGERVLVGSTTDLSKYGFGQYLEQIYANGASLGVMFSADERMYG